LGPHAAGFTAIITASACPDILIKWKRTGFFSRKLWLWFLNQP